MKRQNSSISVVIPVFNGQKTIGDCLNSVLRQSLSSFEIIVINDGSTDQTLHILQEHAKGDERIKLITICNQGVNFARKLGVEQATTDYITFLDADDQLKENALEMYLQQIEGHDALLANCFVDDVIGKEKYLSLMMDERLPKELWGKLFKRILLTNEVMDLPRDIIMGEDYIWNIRTTRAMRSVKLIRDNYYIYDNQNLDSAMHRFKKNIPYEKLFMQFLQASLRGLGKTEREVYELLTVQRFNMFLGFARSSEIDMKEPFIQEIARATRTLRTKRNIVLYGIMQVPSIRLKIILIRLYFSIM